MSVTLPAAAAFLGVASSLTPPVPAPHALPVPVPPGQAQVQTQPAAPAALPAPPKTAPAPAASVSGPYTVHLASYRNHGSAADGWRKLSHAAVPLSGLQPAYRPVEVPGQGAFVRLTAEHFADKAAAQNFCDSIKAAVGYCQPLKG